MRDRRGYGDEEAKRIIERAAEIDAEHGRELDAPALRAIAIQAGISPLAVDRALEEHESMAPARVPRRRRWGGLLIVAAIVALVLFFVVARVMGPVQP